MSWTTNRLRLRIFYILRAAAVLLICCTFAACGGDEADKTITPTLTVSPASPIDIVATGETKNLPITSNTSWKVLCSETWCTPSVTSGSKNGSIDVTVAGNPNITSRSATVTVTTTNGNPVQTVKVTINQTALAPTLTISPDAAMDFAVGGESKNFTVTSNATFAATSDQTTWCTLSVSGTTVTVTAMGNTLFSPRSANITIKTTSGSPEQIKTVSVTQSAALPSLSIFPETLATFAVDGESKSFTVTSNSSWTVTSDQMGWCTVGISGSTVSVIATVNTAVSTRSATITVITTSGSPVQSKTIVVMQAQAHVAYTGGSGDRITWDVDNQTYKIATSFTDAGLYFKYGSVIGIFSGNGKTRTLPDVSTNKDAFDTGDVPFNFSTASITLTGSTGWGQIPYVGAQIDITTAYHTVANVKEGRGDPCRLIGKDLTKIKNTAAASLTISDVDNFTWRLPTEAENAQFVGTFVSITTSATYANSNYPYWGLYGSYLQIGGGWFPVINNGSSWVRNYNAAGFLPAAGYRSSDGTLRHDIEGFYWSNKAINSTYSRCLTFNNDLVRPLDFYNFALGFSVRCVRQE